MHKSIFNDVLGPVMRGPSSSHTAGSYRIARTVRDLLGGAPVEADITFDPSGSYASTYAEQGADQAFATGFMGLEQVDEGFHNALETAAKQDIRIRFHRKALPGADHPNFALLKVSDGTGKVLEVEAKSTGGGSFLVIKLDGLPVALDGKSHVLLLRCRPESSGELSGFIRASVPGSEAVFRHDGGGEGLFQVNTTGAVPPGTIQMLHSHDGVSGIHSANPLYFVTKGAPPFGSAAELLALAKHNSWSLGEAALRYEMDILGLSREAAIEEMLYRYDIMTRSAEAGFDDRQVRMLLLEPTAGKVRSGMTGSRNAIGGIHSRAAAIALAVMHCCNSRGIVCAAPTGGSAGTLPGTVIALEELHSPERHTIADMLFAAGGIGLILAIRGTFAAEVAGCQVEIGAAGAMAAAAVVEYLGGSAQQACDAAAISFQNTMGSVCDLVQGICEIPCHTRNATAASSAFTNADLVLNGYHNPIPLDETIDAVIESGKMLPGELRCTARGGLAMTPSALNMKARRGGFEPL
jgi:L-serine dehydratase